MYHRLSSLPPHCRIHHSSSALKKLLPIRVQQRTHNHPPQPGGPEQPSPNRVDEGIDEQHHHQK